MVLRGPFNNAIGGCENRCTPGGPEVDAAVHGHTLLDRMAPHAERAGDALRFDREAAGDRVEHQALFKCGLTGSVDPLGQRALRLCPQADHDFYVLQLVAQGFQGGGLCVYLQLQLAALGNQALVARLNRVVQGLELVDFGIELADALAEAVDQYRPAEHDQ